MAWSLKKNWYLSSVLVCFYCWFYSRLSFPGSKLCGFMFQSNFLHLVHSDFWAVFFWIGCMAKLFTTSSKGISVSAQWIVGNSIHILDRSAILMHRCESSAPCEDRCGPLQISTIFCCLISFVANGFNSPLYYFCVVVPLSPIQSDFLNVISSFVPFW